MLKRMFLVTASLIAALLLVNQVVIPHVRRARGHDEMRQFCLQKGRDVIMKAVAAHGGLAAWQNKTDISFQLHDQWNSPAGTALFGWLNMWPEREVETRQHYLLRQNTGRIELNAAAGHHVWGYRDFKPWALLNDRIDEKNIARAHFTVPMINYLVELPYRFLDNGAFPEFVNEVKHGDRLYDRVRITFGLNAGNYPPNEYLADFDHQTGRLAFLEYTVRERLPRYLAVRATFENYQQFDGTWIPTQIKFHLTEPIITLALHTWQISDVRFNTGIKESFFARIDDSALGNSGPR
ncbi:MAG: outer membrane lipoprotein-sorting protein [candidate division KSB1 bacterium]|nr:outer membrane lipoprotein-sorting protein [candidate division KSB1 bacterium]MDZ7365913.1 outer membrane lipoprotein-sorting protein [candidate division KSB1 bacterium]MDZ7403853.1 outer membrane lipoprotein-sorting protein [candidate division KSB1 bacterium]